MFNATLADNVLDQIDFDEDSWDQSSWARPGDTTTTIWEANPFRPEPEDAFHGEPVTVCGAKLCFAGHAVVMAGWMLTRDVFSRDTVVNPADGTVSTIWEVAGAELGISSDSSLFSGGNSRDTLGQVVEAYRNGATEDEVSDIVERADWDAIDEDEPCGCGCEVG